MIAEATHEILVKTKTNKNDSNYIKITTLPDSNYIAVRQSNDIFYV
jgi:hypothetical protein